LGKTDEEEFIKLFSNNLREDIITEVNGRVLQENKIFSENFSTKSLLAVSKIMFDKFTSPDEMIFKEGDSQSCGIYFITYGKIQIFQKKNVVTELGPNQYFGEIGFFSGFPHSSGAKSASFSNLFGLSREDAL